MARTVKVRPKVEEPDYETARVANEGLQQRRKSKGILGEIASKQPYRGIQSGAGVDLPGVKMPGVSVSAKKKP